MNGKHESGCNCDDCLEYLGSNDLDQWMPNDEDISGILRTTLSTEDVRSRVTHRHLPFEDAQLNLSHEVPELSLRINNRTPLETERGDVNGDRNQESSTNGDRMLFGDDNPNLALQSSGNFMETRDLGQCLTQTITVSSASSSSTTMPETFVGRRIHKKFGRKMIPATITAWDTEHNFYHVKYDDEDSEDLDVSEMQLSLIPIDNYVGRRINKRFDRKWYTGTITAWDVDDKLYHVKYDDSDSEDLDHGQMHGCLISQRTQEHLQQRTKATRKKRFLQVPSNTEAYRAGVGVEVRVELSFTSLHVIFTSISRSRHQVPKRSGSKGPKHSVKILHLYHVPKRSWSNVPKARVGGEN